MWLKLTVGLQFLPKADEIHILQQHFGFVAHHVTFQLRGLQLKVVDIFDIQLGQFF
jgi:hypothetical protein